MIRKTIILGIVFLFFLLPFATAGSETIYDAFLNVDETAETSIGEFSIRFYEKQNQQDTMILEKTDESGFRLLIDDGECEFEEEYKYCFQGSQVGRHDYEKDKDIMALKLFIAKLSPSLERTFSKKDLMVGEEAEVSVTISIPDNRRATVSYVDKFPEGYQLNSGKANVRGDTIMYDGRIDGDFTFTYYVKLMRTNIEPYISKGTLNYDFEGKTGRLVTEEVELKKLSDLVIEAEFEPEEAEIGEEVELEINLDKKIDDSLKINKLEIIFPSGTEFIQTEEDFEQIGLIHKWKSDRLTEDKEYKFQLWQKSSEDYVVKIIAEIDRNGNIQTQEAEAILKSGVKDLKLGLIIPSTIRYSKNINLRAYFDNKNEKTSFRNIQCSISGDLFSKDYSFENSFAGKKTNIEDESLTIEDTSPRNVTHTFTCTYNLPTGQSKTVEVKKESVINITASETEEEDEDLEGEIVEDGELDRKIGFKDEDDKEDTETDDGDEDEEDDEPGFFKKIIDWFKGLFSGEDTEEESEDLEEE
ncbi:MAG: hypothetical protein KAT43_00815 [Nanoarchaeota archaeon]|nr:hypothetical protein [Nanoarchaeota archaeon]